MTNPTKTVFDFPREQHKHLQLEGNSGWHEYGSWSCWSFDYASQREARLAKREARTANGECSPNWKAITLGTLALNISRESSIRYTITEVIPGAEPEPDWKAECERLRAMLGDSEEAYNALASREGDCQARIRELETEKKSLLEAHNHGMRVRSEKTDRIRDLEGSLAAASAAVQKLEKWRNGLENIGPIYGAPEHSRVWLEKVSE